MPSVTRRRFQATAATAIAAASRPAVSAARVAGANERVRLGFIGLGNRGDQVLDAFLAQPDAQVVAIADLHTPYLDFAAAKIGGAPARYTDYRKLLDHTGLDAVVIATPDHWHALQMIQACQAGKDVYVEKPLSLCVAEGRRMVEAQKKHGRVVQVGIQRLSSPMLAEVAAFVQGGGIGKVTSARAFHVQNEWPKGIGSPPDEDPPPGFDWDAWQGPAPARRFNRNRTFYRFRWFYDYSGGQLTNFGTHYLATIHRVLGVQAPLAVTAMGGKFANYDNREVPDTLEVLWHYPGDTLVTFSQFNSSAAPAAARGCEVEFRGTKGTLFMNSNGWEMVPEVITPNEFAARTPVDRSLERGYREGAKALLEPRKGTGGYPDVAHARNFLDCVKSRATPSCDLEFGHRATSACLVAGIAHRTRSLLEWDAAHERFAQGERANAMLDYRYCKPYDEAQHTI
ncbi:MAG: Gfo/Idh/MocA family protein [Planctomycetia bacterium]